MKRGHLRGVGIALFVTWLFAVYAAFYWVQKPFTPETAWALLQVGLGRRILIWLGLADLPPAGLVWLAPALGLSGLAVVASVPETVVISVYTRFSVGCVSNVSFQQVGARQLVRQGLRPQNGCISMR